MGAIGLSLHTITVLNKRTDENLLFDDKITSDPESLEIKDIINIYFESLKPTINEKKSKVFQLKKYDFDIEDNYYEYTGIVESGEYGYSSTIVDLEDNVELLKRKPTHAELLPFFFHLSLPKERDRGIVQLQSFRQFSIKGVFEYELNKYIKQINSDLKISISSIMPKEYVMKMIEVGRLMKLNFIRYETPVDVADALGGYPDGVRENEMQEVYTVKANRGKSVTKNVKPKILRFFRDNTAKVSDLIELKDFDYNALTVEVEVNKNKKTFDIGNYHNSTPKFDITDEVEYSEDGHPRYESIIEVSNEWKIQFANDIKLSENNTADDKFIYWQSVWLDNYNTHSVNVPIL